MGFLAPSWLWLLGLAGIPILIHLLHRIRLPRIPFSSLFFLSSSKKEKFSWLHLKEILLLIFRTAFVFFLLLSLARPYFKKHLFINFNRSGKYDASRVIILDDSYSMAYGDNFSRAKEQVGKLLRDLSRSSEVAIITSSGKFISDFVTQKALLPKMLDTLSVSYFAKSMEEALHKSFDMLQKASFTQKEIFIVTDLQKSAIEPILPLLASKDLSQIKFWMIDVGSKNPDNIGIKEIFLQPSFPTPDLPFQVNVKLKNYTAKNKEAVLQCNIKFINSNLSFSNSKVSVQNAVLKNDVVESQILQSAVFLKPNEEKVITFNTEIKKPGHYLIQASISDDSLFVDNQYYWTLNIPQTTPILLLYEHRPDIQYIEKALAQSYFEITALEAKLLRQHNLNKYRAIGIFAPSQLNYADWERLAYFVQQGKGCFVVLNKEIKETRWHKILNLQLDLTGYNVTLDTRFGFVTIDKINYSHPIMEIFRDIDLSSAKFFNYWKLSDVSDTSVSDKSVSDKSNLSLRQKQTLAYFSSGNPFLLEDPNQRIIIALSSFDIRTTDFMFKPIFLPMLHRIFSYLALSDLPTKYQVGDVIKLRLLSSHPMSNVKIKTPTSEIYQVINQSPENKIMSKPMPNVKTKNLPNEMDEFIIQTSNLKTQNLLEFTNTSVPGFYQIQDQFFCVNVNPEESNLLKIPEGQLKQYGISVIKDVEGSFIDFSRASIYLSFMFLILELVVLCI
ncbi:MAG: BatA and WFA domain-containing protein [candidate division WOR-3 bacterium]|nr:BatA and WFA domain-containing protein [candidate division WOR-3 bacterium]